MTKILYPNFVLDKKRNRRELSNRAKSFIKLSSDKYKFLNDFPKLDYYECRELSLILNNEDRIEESKYSFSAEEAKQYFISCNLKLVRNIACDYSLKYSTTDPEDLFQMGVIGLIRAVEKWDHEREFLFSTYATWWIKQSISRECMNTSDLIRIPVHMLELQPKVVDYYEKYVEFFGREPDLSEACDALEIEEYQLRNVLDSLFIIVPLAEATGFEGELVSRTAITQNVDSSNLDPDSLVSLTLLRENLDQVLWGLTSREASIVVERFGLDSGQCATLDEIGILHGVTRERIRQIEKKIFEKLRHPSRSEFLRDYLEIDCSTFGHLSYSVKPMMSAVDFPTNRFD